MSGARGSPHACTKGPVHFLRSVLLYATEQPVCATQYDVVLQNFSMSFELRAEREAIFFTSEETLF